MFFWKPRDSAEGAAGKNKDNARTVAVVLAFLLAVRTAPYVLAKLR